jgi:hypothetical protein
MFRPITFYCVGTEILTAMVMKSSAYWDITPCSSVIVNQRFGGTYHLHFQSEKALLDALRFLGLLFDPEDVGDMFLRNVG